MATYKHLKYDGHEIQVGSAIRDGSGKNIATKYATNDSVDSKISQVTGELSPVATSGDYNDLVKNKPQINGVTLEGNKTNTDLGIATKVSQLENDSKFIDKEVNNLTNYSTTAKMNEELDKKVTSELTGTKGKSIIFNEKDGGGSKFESNALTNTDAYIGIHDAIATTNVGVQAYATDKAGSNGVIIDVVKTGAYYNKGTVQSGDKRLVDAREIAVIEDIPTKTSQLTNDSDFITTAYHDNTKADDSAISKVGKSNSYTDLDNKPSIPAKVSELANDTGYITESALTPYATTESVETAIEGRKLVVLSIANYGFNEDIRVNQQVDGADLVNKVISVMGTEGRQVVLKAGTYQFNVTSVLDDTKYSGVKGFSIVSLNLPMSTLEDKPELQKCVFLFNPMLGSTGKTCTFYEKSFTNVEIQNLLTDMATKTWVNEQGFLKEHQSLENYYTKTETDDAISAHHDNSKQDILTAGANITIQKVGDNTVISASDLYEPDEYIKSATVNANTLTLKKKDNTNVVFNPEKGSVVTVSSTGTATDTVQFITIDGVERKLAGGSGEPENYIKSVVVSNDGAQLTLTKKDNSTVVYHPAVTLENMVTNVDVGNLPAETSIPAGTSLYDILKTILCGTAPTTKTYFYWGASDTVPTTSFDVNTLSKQEVTKEQLLTDGYYIQKTITLDNQYPVFALTNMEVNHKAVFEQSSELDSIETVSTPINYIFYSNVQSTGSYTYKVTFQSSTWSDPVQVGNLLSADSVYGASQNENTLSVE